MPFVISIKTAEDIEAGVIAEVMLTAAMATYLEELHRGGALPHVSGRRPNSKDWCVKHSKGKRTIVDGPFTETKELKVLQVTP